MSSLPLLIAATALAAAPPQPPLLAPEGASSDAEVLALCGDALLPAAAARCEAVVRLRGVPTLSPGPVRRARVRPGRVLRGSPRGPLRVDLFLGKQRGRIERVRLGSSGYRLLYRPHRGEPVTLYECQSTDAAQWALLWAGDLDGDARLDLLLDASDAFDRSELRLFLSRDAQEPVEEVAVLERVRD